MLTLHIEAPTYAALKALAAKALGAEPTESATPPAPSMPEPTPTPAAPDLLAAAVPPPAPPARRGRPPRIPAPTPAAADSSAGASPANAAQPAAGAGTEITIDQCRGILQEINTREGMQAAMAFLSSFGEARISALPEAKRPKFMEDGRVRVAAWDAVHPA